jgi:gluconate 2-dehydrogenase gamma chain
VASNEAARSPGSLAPMSRRQVSAVYQFLSPHQAAVLDAATGHVIPGPKFGALELDHPELYVVTYVDRVLSLVDVQTPARQVRVADLRDQYTDGIALLDQLAGGDFTAVPRLCQGFILSHTRVAPFVSLLVDHVVEAIYAPPENRRCNAADRYHETG